MGYWASELILDGRSSAFYNLYLDTTEETDSLFQSSSNIAPIVQEIPRRSTPFLLGVKYTPVLEFDVALYSAEEINAKMQQSILRWFTGHSQYRKLQFIQHDLMDTYFNCLITDPQVRKIGNLIHGFKFHVRCDSQWAWSFEKKLSYTFASPPNAYVINYYNKTDQEDYIYPKMNFTMNGSGGNISITNVSESGRISSFTSLLAYEHLEVDNDYKTIQSTISGTSTGLLRVANSNKKWFRLVPGKNQLSVTGNISSLNIWFNIPRKIG